MNLEQLHARDITVGIIGLGFAGLPLAVAFAEAGIEVIGVDSRPEHVQRLNEGQSLTPDVPAEQLSPLVEAGLLRGTTRYAHLSDADAILICVPTPARASQEPELSFLVQAIEGLLPHVKEGALVVLQSVGYPGTTEEMLLPRLASRGGTVGQDFFLACSPERADPGNRRYRIRNTPRVVGGITPACTELAAALFEIVADEIIRLSNSRTAEMTKLLENSFRAVNTGLANEAALICERLDINVWEVIAAAASHPAGFMPFYPGPRTEDHGLPARFSRVASEINASMVEHVVTMVSRALNQRRKAINGSRILTLGVSAKADVPDVRESPALPIMQRLRELGAELLFHDPLIPECELEDGTRLNSLPVLHAEDLEAADLALILTAHRSYNWEGIVRHSALIVDTRNATYAVRRHASGSILCL